MKELSIEEKAKAYDGNYKAYTELINRLEDVKDAIKKQNYGIAMDILCKPYPGYQITISTELKESEDEKIRKSIINLVIKSAQNGGMALHKWESQQMIAWLEKQGEQKSYVSETMNEKEDFDNGFTRMMEKEQKTVDKVEPKFKAGDWITNGKCTWKIDSIDEDMYYNNHCGIDCGGDIKSIDEEYHLWTIQDAKAGDVILDGSNPFIFKKTKYQSKHCYAFCGIEQNGNFVVNPYNWYGKEDSSEVWTWGRNLKPATKEQSNTLFAKMKEAGYEWNAEKKELKRIEQKYTPKHKVGDTIYYNSFGEVNSMVVANVVTDSTNNPMYEDKEGNAVFEKALIEQKSATMSLDEAIEHCKEKSCGNNACALEHKQLEKWLTELKELKEQNPAWTEEDEKHLKLAIDNFQTLGNSFLTAWLKSLKDRVQPQQEWSEEDEKHLKGCMQYFTTITKNSIFYKDYLWLKSLRPHSQWKPSEEQMKALYEATLEGEPVEALETLLSDLKKLK